MCWENRGLGSPAGPGLSMVVPVNWMVSRKIWINWSCEMVWPDALGISGMPCGSRYWAGNLLSILSKCLFIAWCGQMRWKCRADWQMQECPRATQAPAESVFWTGRVRNVVFSVAVVWCQTCNVVAAAASMPLSSHQQQISVASILAAGSSSHVSCPVGKLYGQIRQRSSTSKESLKGVGPIPLIIDLVVFLMSCCRK